MTVARNPAESVASGGPPVDTGRRTGPRIGRRRPIAESRVLARILPHHTEPHLVPAVKGRVIDVSPRGLAVAVKGSAEALSRFQSADAAVEIEHRDHTYERFANLVIRHVTNECGQTVIGLEACDEETAARLWELAYAIGDAAQGADATAAPAELTRIPGRGHYSETARRERLAFLREHSGAPLAAVDPAGVVPEKLAGNIENLVGTVEVPVGIAGPLLVNGQHIQGVVYAPLATTEGALVASASRGAVALSEAGGVRTRVLQQRMLRAPMFVLANLDAAWRFSQWLYDHLSDISHATNSVSAHAELVRIEPFQIGNIVHVRFVYETGDAAGQNMTTSCTWQACRWILEQVTTHHPDIEIVNFTLEGNMSGDKKVSYLSFIAGRGVRVTAECVVPGDVLEDVLKVSPERLAHSFRQSISGGIQAGTVGYNVNVANVVAAMFVATGQDIACVHESSLGILHVDATDDALYASLLMPGLVIGTVGGGTQLPAQRQYLESLGCDGPDKVSRLAEIICATALALDISTMSAIESGSFAGAHERLGRNRPVRFLTQDDLTPAFFEDGLRMRHHDPGLCAVAAEPVDSNLGTSIISELSSRQFGRVCGLLPYRLSWQSSDGSDGTDDVLVKAKVRDDEVLLTAQLMATACGEPTASQFERFRDRLPFRNCHIRELKLYELADERMRRYMPHCYRTFREDDREAYVIVEELLHSDVVLMNTENDPSRWREDDLICALDGVAACHAAWWGRAEELAAHDWMQPVMTAADMAEMIPLWDALVSHAAREFPGWFSDGELAVAQHAVESLGDWWPRLEALPRTLVHNDFTLRNVALRELEGGERRLVAWDWELATIGPPQHDLAEFLVFGLTPDVAPDVVDRCVEAHRASLERYCGQRIDPDAWREGFRLSLWDLLVNRMPMYLVGHTFREYPFMRRSIETHRSLLHFVGRPEPVAM